MKSDFIENDFYGFQANSVFQILNFVNKNFCNLFWYENVSLDYFP